MKKNDDLISIIIPVFNGEKYVKECVESLMQQTYQNIEIILVDDGSKDNTKNIIENLMKEDNRIIYIYQENSGVSKARNTGIQKSSGNYITFVDSDDRVQKEYVEYLYNLIKENNADISLTRYPLKFNRNTKINQYKDGEDFIEVVDGLSAAKEMLYYKIVISSWNKMFHKRKLLDNNVYFNSNLSFGEGFDFVINAFLNSSKVVIGNRRIYHYRVDNQNSVMTKFSPKLVTGSIDSQNSIYKRIHKIIKNNSQKGELLKAWNYSFWHTNCDCFNTIIGCNVKKEKFDMYEAVKKNCKKKALCVLDTNVPNKEKVKGIMYFISPYVTAKLINKFRIRKYTEE